jgi:hypothetical protein
MATTKRTQPAKRTAKKAQPAASIKKTIAQVPRQARTAISKQASSVASKRPGGSSPKTKAELYQLARQRDLPGRSKMGRDELARKLGVR